MNCKDCANRPKLGNGKDEQYYVDIIDAMAERTNRRSHLLNIILSVLLAACIVAIIWLNNARVSVMNELLELERSIETTYEYDYDIEQDANDGGRNFDKEIASIIDHGTSFDDCRNLANLLICKAGLENAELFQTRANFELKSGTEFARVANVVSSEAVLTVMDELMTVLQSTNPSLYAGALRKIEEAAF